MRNHNESLRVKELTLSPVAQEVLERLSLGHEDPRVWLDDHRYDVLVLWRELGCTDTATALKITPSELDGWRRDRNILLPQPWDPIDGEEDAGPHRAIERLISNLLPDMHDRWTPWFDEHKADIVGALRGCNKSELSKALNAPVGTLYSWAASRGLYQRTHHTSRGNGKGTSYVNWLQEHPDEVKEALRQIGTIKGAARALKVPFSSLKIWVDDNRDILVNS